MSFAVGEPTSLVLCCRGLFSGFDILNVPCGLFLGWDLASVSGWTLDPHCSPVSSPAYGSGSIYSWLDSLFFPWICCTSCLDLSWTMDGTGSISAHRVQTLWVPVGESTARARSPLILHVPAWGSSHPLLLPSTDSAELSAPLTFPAASLCAMTTSGAVAAASSLLWTSGGMDGSVVTKDWQEWWPEILLFANITINQSSYPINSWQPRASWALLHSSRLHTRFPLEGTPLEVTPWGWDVSCHSGFLISDY